MSLTLTNIPRIMRRQHWFNGAALMDTWFSRPSAIKPKYSAPDTTTIEMDAWALKFVRAKEVYDKLIQERIWANAAALAVLAAMLRRNGLLTGAARRFGDLSQPASALHADQVNFRTVGGKTLDDMLAALGHFAFYVSVAGEITPVVEAPGAGGSGPLPAAYQVAITEIGVYIVDSFDFEGDQDLGYWDDSDNTVSGWNPLTGTSVSNSDFRDWRAKTGRGGDFLVYSDVKRTTLATPDIVTIR
jgi:Family of unknown function (DUF6402)